MADDDGVPELEDMTEVLALRGQRSTAPPVSVAGPVVAPATAPKPAEPAPPKPAAPATMGGMKKGFLLGPRAKEPASAPPKPASAPASSDIPFIRPTAPNNKPGVVGVLGMIASRLTAPSLAPRSSGENERG